MILGISNMKFVFAVCLCLMILDVQRQGSSNDDFSGRNGHLPSKSYNDRAGYNGGKWYNEKRGNNRRSEDLRSKSDFNYREQSGGRAGNSNKQRTERDVVSADRESNSSVENNNSRRRPKAKNTHNQSNSGKSNDDKKLFIFVDLILEISGASLI